MVLRSLLRYRCSARRRGFMHQAHAWIMRACVSLRTLCSSCRACACVHAMHVCACCLYAAAPCGTSITLSPPPLHVPLTPSQLRVLIQVCVSLVAALLDAAPVCCMRPRRCWCARVRACARGAEAPPSPSCSSLQAARAAHRSQPAAPWWRAGAPCGACQVPTLPALRP